MLLSWIWTILAGRSPFLLCWRAGGDEHSQIYRYYFDAWLASAAVLSQSPVETMSLTDRNGRPLPFPAYALLTWRWGSEEYSIVLRERRQAGRRVRDLAAHRSLEFVGLTRPDGRFLLTPERFRRLRAGRLGRC